MPGFEFFILLGAGFLIGTAAVIMGGTMFLSVPLVQWLFPEISFGAVVGNLKVGSFCTFSGSILSTYKKINFFQNLRLTVFAFIGTVLGASAIAHLDQKWVFPAVVIAVLLCILAPKVAHLVTGRTFNIASFFTGVYAGFFGAGIGLIVLALLRTQYPQDTQIALAKIQTRFIEWLLLITAVVTHIIHGNLIFAIWVPWAMGGLCGGVIGGLLLTRIGKLSGQTQKYILYAAFAFALIVAGARFF